MPLDQMRALRSDEGGLNHMALSFGGEGGVAGRPRSRDRGRALRPFVIFPGGYQKEYIVVRTSNTCMLQAYKYRMYPSQEQVASLMHHIHACRFVYNKAIQKLARCREKVSNQRNDFLHKLLNRVVGENQAIAVESLNIAGMQKNRCLAQSISGVSWSAFFTMLEYKCQMHGKMLSKIGRFDPSSKICSTCGYLNRDLARKDREWICPDCGIHHDRDISAAINIKKFALQDQNLVGVSGAKRAEGPVDSLPMGRGMIAGKPRPQARGSSHEVPRPKGMGIWGYGLSQGEGVPLALPQMPPAR